MTKPATCPGLTVEMGPVVDAVTARVKKDLRREMGMETVHNDHRSGLGMIRFLPQSGTFKAVPFGVGVLVGPAVVNFGARLLEKPGLISTSGWSRPVVQSLAALGTLGIHVFTGGGSFTLGAFLGQMPLLMDELAGIAANAVMGDVPTPTRQPVTMVGIGNSADEIRRLRLELERMSGRGGRMGDSAEGNAAGSEGVGALRGHMTVR
jgi:hypothetical protein